MYTRTKKELMLVMYRNGCINLDCFKNKNNENLVNRNNLLPELRLTEKMGVCEVAMENCERKEKQLKLKNIIFESKLTPNSN